MRAKLNEHVFLCASAKESSSFDISVSLNADVRISRERNNRLPFSICDVRERSRYVKSLQVLLVEV